MSAHAPAPVATDDLARADGGPPLAAAYGPFVWEWLAALFARPFDAAEIAAHREGWLAVFLADLAADPGLAPTIEALRAAIAGDPAAAAIRVAIAHRRLFDGLAGPETVPPYESAHVGDGRLFQAPVGEMERLIAAHDLRVADDAHEPADHLAIELALMARLVAHDHADRAGLAARLAGWVPAFARACEARDRVGFHAAAARLLTVVVEREARSRSPRETRRPEARGEQE